jgi:hypothetical protein
MEETLSKQFPRQREVESVLFKEPSSSSNIRGPSLPLVEGIYRGFVVVDARCPVVVPQYSIRGGAQKQCIKH